MSAPPPKPLFVFFGIDGGATCCHIENSRMFIGSLNGKVQEFNLDSKTLKNEVYVDEEERRIQSIGYSDEHLFVHIRGHAILKLSSAEKGSWNTVNSVEVDHIGFCNSLLIGPFATFVSSDPDRIPLLCWTNLEENEVSVKSSRIGDKSDNTPMNMTRGEGEKEVVIGMEDGRLAITEVNPTGWELTEMIELGKEPVFCVASCSKWIAAGCARAPIYLVSREDRKTKKEVHYPPDSSGCSSITFSPNEKQILAGFGDGTIRVFSCLRLTVLLALSSTHSASITSLTWRRPEESELVVATSSDSTVSLWRLR